MTEGDEARTAIARPDAVGPTLRLGIDLGGTKIAGVVLEGRGGTLAEARVATPRGDYAATLTAIKDLVARLEQTARGTATLGIGMPGAISSRTGLVKNANSVWLNGQPFARDLERTLGRPVRIENDANCLAVSEAVDGAGAEARIVWAIILGTGAGSGIAIDGRVLSGRDRIAGEWGHNPLPWPQDDERPGPVCYCGRRGCIETFVSGTGLAADHAITTGDRLTGEAIVAKARDGDEAARRTITRYRDRLGRSIAHVVNVLDPDVIVLGGGLSQVPELVSDLAPQVAPHVFTDAFDTPIRPSRYGDASGVRGAAWLWNDEPIA